MSILSNLLHLNVVLLSIPVFLVHSLILLILETRQTGCVVLQMEDPLLVLCTRSLHPLPVVSVNTQSTIRVSHVSQNHKTPTTPLQTLVIGRVVVDTIEYEIPVFSLSNIFHLSVALLSILVLLEYLMMLLTLETMLTGSV